MGTPVQEEKLLIAFPLPLPAELIHSIQKKYPNVKIECYELDPDKSINDQAPLPDENFQDVTILATFSALPSRPEFAPNLKFIHLVSAGSDHIQKHPIYTDSKIPITTSSGIHGPMISEWVILQILSNSHKQRLLLDWQEKHYWGALSGLGELYDLVGQRIGILGYGSIGRQVAVVCKALGMEVYAYTASRRKTPESRRDKGYIVPGTGDIAGTIPSAWYSGLEKPNLHNFLAQDLDILLISVPLTKETTHLIGAVEFSILAQTALPKKKHGTFIANISRGNIIVQDELELFLREGKLRGAALDVTVPEPLPKDSSLWDVEGLAITPHISGLSAAYLERSVQVLERNIGNLEAGKRLVNLVDRQKGY